MDSRKAEGKRWYLVQWKDWPEEYTSWQPEENVAGSQDLLREYEETVKPRRRAKKRKG